MGLRPRFTTPLTRFRDAFRRYVVLPFNVFEPQTRFLIGFAVLVMVTMLLLLAGYSSGFAETYKEGEIVRRTIVAPTDITTPDIAEDERRRATAREQARPVFNFDSTRGGISAESFRAAWEDLSEQAKSKPGVTPKWTGEGGRAVARVIMSRGFKEEDLSLLTGIMRRIADGYIYDDSDAERLNREIVLVDVRNPSARMIVPSPRTQMKALSEARRNLDFEIRSLRGWSNDEKNALIEALVPLIRPNVVLDQTATATAREVEANKVPQVLITLKRNQVVAREGDTVTPAMLSQFAALRGAGQGGRPLLHIIGVLLVVCAVYWAAWKFTEHQAPVASLSLSPRRAFALVGSAIVVETALMRVGFIFSDSVALQMRNAPFNESIFWSFAIPFGAAALLVAMLVDTQLAFLTGVVTAVFAAIIGVPGVPIAIFALISCSAAIYGIGRYRERQSVTLAGLITGAANVVMAVSVIAYTEQSFSFKAVLLAMACGFAGGLLTAIFAAGGLPVNESFFGILTDVKLLELSNADLPVLGQLALRAPGTNQHSHAVGQLAEDACRAVGANPLLARIGALYHDIGKLAAPEYFVENQQGYNPHDHLKPLQSAKIITSHVTYGQKLSKEIGLPKKIADFIPQHHGTRTLHFFLRKAQAMAKPGEKINEDEFRYPGPKPNFKEAAIMMLADSCEAAARSLARPDPQNIRLIVIKIVDAIISDGQLDECDLTLRELTTIREAMISALTAIYHARIDYPGFNPPPVTGPLPPLPQADLDSEERGVMYGTPAEVPINKSGEVEDEAVSRKVAKR